MSSDNIATIGKAVALETKVTVREHQLDLFQSAQDAVPRLAIFDPSHYDEGTFINAINRHSVNLVIDLRMRPVFDSPRYSHRSITSYFFERKIKYLEIAGLVYKSDSCQNRIENELEMFFSADGLEQRFFGFCLIDERLRKEGVVADMRAEIRKHNTPVVEVHPRAIGMQSP